MIYLICLSDVCIIFKGWVCSVGYVPKHTEGVFSVNTLPKSSVLSFGKASIFPTEHSAKGSVRSRYRHPGTSVTSVRPPKIPGVPVYTLPNIPVHLSTGTDLFKKYPVVHTGIPYRCPTEHTLAPGYYTAANMSTRYSALNSCRSK